MKTSLFVAVEKTCVFGPVTFDNTLLKNKALPPYHPDNNNLGLCPDDYPPLLSISIDARSFECQGVIL